VYRYFFLATILFFEKFFLILFPEVYDKRPIPTKLTLHFSQAAFPGGLVFNLSASILHPARTDFYIELKNYSTNTSDTSMAATRFHDHLQR